LEKKTGLSVYVADPYAAWQWGADENTNGLLGFYLPKGTDFKSVSDEDLQWVIDRLNNRPTHCLNYRTSQGILMKPEVVHLQIEFTVHSVHRGLVQA
jgi:IS30 family transposase